MGRERGGRAAAAAAAAVGATRKEERRGLTSRGDDDDRCAQPLSRGLARMAAAKAWAHSSPQREAQERAGGSAELAYLAG